MGCAALARVTFAEEWRPDIAVPAPHDRPPARQGWLVVGASVAGWRHRERNVPCQDAHLIHRLPTGELLIAVADGAGRAASAADAARSTTARAVASLQRIMQAPPRQAAHWPGVLRGVFGDVREELARRAGLAQVELRAFSTTLTTVIVAADWLVVGQVGDGAVVAQDTAGACWLAAPPQNGETMRHTDHVTAPEALPALDVQVYPPVPALAVTTDGLLPLALARTSAAPRFPRQYAPAPGFFQPLLEYAATATDPRWAERDLAGFLASERVCARTGDDKTLVLAVRRDLPPATMRPAGEP
ncbi:MAG TPA: protein phosphatase 2C domain-containing protein [Thermomicrobiales bacterium]|nr:protein phosphatase 2C domain-containing protein [Thermomicrobiales bacterium]